MTPHATLLFASLPHRFLAQPGPSFLPFNERPFLEFHKLFFKKPLARGKREVYLPHTRVQNGRRHESFQRQRANARSVRRRRVLQGDRASPIGVVTGGQIERRWGMGIVGIEPWGVTSIGIRDRGVTSIARNSPDRFDSRGGGYFYFHQAEAFRTLATGSPPRGPWAGPPRGRPGRGRGSTR